MEPLLELLMEIQDIAGVAIEAIQQAMGGEGGAPPGEGAPAGPEGGAPPEELPPPA